MMITLMFLLSVVSMCARLVSIDGKNDYYCLNSIETDHTGKHNSICTRSKLLPHYISKVIEIHVLQRGKRPPMNGTSSKFFHHFHLERRKQPKGSNYRQHK